MVGLFFFFFPFSISSLSLLYLSSSIRLHFFVLLLQSESLSSFFLSASAAPPSYSFLALPLTPLDPYPLPFIPPSSPSLYFPPLLLSTIHLPSLFPIYHVQGRRNRKRKDNVVAYRCSLPASLYSFSLYSLLPPSLFIEMTLLSIIHFSFPLIFLPSLLLLPIFSLSSLSSLIPSSLSFLSFFFYLPLYILMIYI